MSDCYRPGCAGAIHEQHQADQRAAAAVRPTLDRFRAEREASWRELDRKTIAVYRARGARGDAELADKMQAELDGAPPAEVVRLGFRAAEAVGDVVVMRVLRELAEREGISLAAPATLVVVNCTGAKASEPRPAGELYLGSSYLFARPAADAVAAGIPGGRVVILSALHGLLELDEVIAPYNVTMGDPGQVSTQRLADQITAAGAARIIALTPNGYTAALLDAADVADVPLTAPLLGCRGIGEQRGRLARLRDGRATVDAVPAPGEPAGQMALFAA